MDCLPKDFRKEDKCSNKRSPTGWIELRRAASWPNNKFRVLLSVLKRLVAMTRECRLQLVNLKSRSSPGGSGRTGKKRKKRNQNPKRDKKSKRHRKPQEKIRHKVRNATLSAESAPCQLCAGSYA